MGEMQEILNSLIYAINQKQIISIQVFIDNQAILQALQNPNKCSVP